MNNTIRPTAVAGLFYPGERGALEVAVKNYLKDIPQDSSAPKAIIAPHAGYIYSGPVAATAYKRLGAIREIIKQVILIGPSHRYAFDGLAISRHASFNTPLGIIPLAMEPMTKIAHFDFVHYLDQAHQLEHSLEVQLPFLQTILNDFNLVPIVAGSSNPDQVKTVLKTLWGGPETLIVISSDLSHYLDYQTAKHKDAETSQFIENLEYTKLGPDSACGRIPVSGLMAYAQQENLQIKTIDLRNSGDTAGDKSRVVGYGAYVIESTH